MCCTCVFGLSLQVVDEGIYGRLEPTAKIHAWHCSQLWGHVVSSYMGNKHRYVPVQCSLPFDRNVRRAQTVRRGDQHQMGRVVDCSRSSQSTPGRRSFTSSHAATSRWIKENVKDSAK